MTPKFPVGTVVRIANPDQFFVSFANKIRDRDAVVMENMMDFLMGGAQREFNGRVLVEFQKRNGRGKVFTEVIHERNFVAKDAA